MTNMYHVLNDFIVCIWSCDASIHRYHVQVILQSLSWLTHCKTDWEMYASRVKIETISYESLVFSKKSALRLDNGGLQLCWKGSVYDRFLRSAVQSDQCWTSLVRPGLVWFGTFCETPRGQNTRWSLHFFFIYYVNIINAVKSMQILILVILE